MNFEIGAELRRVRIARKLSLRSVATAVNVSASLLSQVETGKTQPSVSTLYALVNHLGISLDGLMKGQSSGAATSAATANYEDGHHGIVQRRSENPSIEMENGVVWERLADGGRVDADPLMVTYEPGSSSSVEGKKAEAPKEKPSTCASCNKSIKNKRWYYRNGKYYCSKRCWQTAVKKEKAPAQSQEATPQK